MPVTAKATEWLRWPFASLGHHGCGVPAKMRGGVSLLQERVGRLPAAHFHFDVDEDTRLDRVLALFHDSALLNVSRFGIGRRRSAGRQRALDGTIRIGPQDRLIDEDTDCPSAWGTLVGDLDHRLQKKDAAFGGYAVNRFFAVDRSAAAGSSGSGAFVAARNDGVADSNGCLGGRGRCGEQ